MLGLMSSEALPSAYIVCLWQPLHQQPAWLPTKIGVPDDTAIYPYWCIVQRDEIDPNNTTSMPNNFHIGCKLDLRRYELVPD